MKRMRWSTMAAAILLGLAQAGVAGAAVDVSVRLDNPFVPLRSNEERVIQIDVTAPPGLPERGHRVPVNLALVIDRSGSMAGANKLGWAVEAACRIVDAMEAGDRIAVVAYDNRVIVPVPSQAVEDAWAIKRAIRALSPGASTDLNAGLTAGIRQVERYAAAGQVNRVILLSDGLANTGIIDPHAIGESVSTAYRGGITVSTVGVGSDFNEFLMTALAQYGGGRYHFIAEPAQIPSIIVAEFSGARRAELLAASVVIRIRGGELVTVYGVPFRRDGADIVIELGDLPGDCRRRIMAAVRPFAATAGTVPLADVEVVYRAPGAGDRTERLRREVTITVTEDARRVSSSFDREIVAEKGVVESNVALDRASDLVDKGRGGAAIIILKEEERRLTALPQTGRVQQELSKNRDYQKAVEAAPAMSAEGKQMMQKKLRQETYDRLNFY